MSVWDEIRREFPATDRFVYLNAAAASPIPRAVAAAATQFYRDFEAEGDVPWDRWLARTEDVRALVARFVGATADEIAFVPNTSVGINIVADLLAEDGPVLTNELEFPTVTLPWIHRGTHVRFVAAEESGALRVSDFAQTPNAPTRTIVISHVQFSNGCRQDLARYGAVKEGRWLVVCGSQSAGAFPIDVVADGVDAFVTSGHKWMCAGYGAGFLCVRRHLIAHKPPRVMGWRSIEDPYTFDNRRYRLLPSERRFELGCPSFAPIVALGAAVELLLGIGIEAIAARVLALNTYLTDGLRRLGVDVLSPGGSFRSGETLCRVPEPQLAAAFLADRGVLVSVKPQGLRIATHFFNSEEDVSRGLAALRAYLRESSTPTHS